MEHYLIIVEKGVNNYSAYSPDLQGCVATGKTVEETINKMRDAICFHIEGLQEQGDILPFPQPFEKHVNQIDVDSGDIFAFVGIQLESVAA
ncbi:MAG: type II toxin-antitoxin system HicB family antitoxin [Desulfamplus sp.]|nr:type II toxin-antitoxin system HicB family antitoxin [Desulfamplus sp.]